MKATTSLLLAIPQVTNVAQVCMLVTVVYALFGMQFLMGRMAACTDQSIRSKDQCVGNYVAEASSGESSLPAMRQRWWGNDDLGNFDHIFYAMLTLFEMATLEMWPDVLWRTMDAYPEAHDVGPVRDANPWMASFIISWIVISNFILLNLFVGVVLENFNAIRKAEDGSGFMNDAQREWARAMSAIFSVKGSRKLREPEGKGAIPRFRRKVFQLVEGDRSLASAFEKSVALLVVLNVLSMAITWYGQPAWVWTSFVRRTLFGDESIALDLRLNPNLGTTSQRGWMFSRRPWITSSPSPLSLRWR